MASIQLDLGGNPTFHGVCDERCWDATEKRCQCRCGGAHHGQGRRREEVES